MSDHLHNTIVDGCYRCELGKDEMAGIRDDLIVGTPADNHGDMVSRGRQAKGDMLPHTKLADVQVQEIRRRYDPKGGGTGRGGSRSNASHLADEFGVSRAYIMQLVHGWYRKDVA